jgi:hypothetical protein
VADVRGARSAPGILCWRSSAASPMELWAMCVIAPATSTDITFIHAEGVAMGDTAVADALKQICQAIGELVSA